MVFPNWFIKETKIYEYPSYTFGLVKKSVFIISFFRIKTIFRINY